MTSSDCAEYARLRAEVNATLEKLRQIAHDQLQAFRSKDDQTFMRRQRIGIDIGFERTKYRRSQAACPGDKCQSA
jgi:hypothetical protein